ncbi:MAG: hypothetical protein KBC84_02360 [Proteobacteria bacterium]|nr:hypothetical protein [Pseudomonadota bacterium]
MPFYKNQGYLTVYLLIIICISTFLAMEIANYNHRGATTNKSSMGSLRAKSNASINLREEFGNLRYDNSSENRYYLNSQGRAQTIIKRQTYLLVNKFSTTPYNPDYKYITKSEMPCDTWIDSNLNNKYSSIRTCKQISIANNKSFYINGNLKLDTLKYLSSGNENIIFIKGNLEISHLEIDTKSHSSPIIIIALDNIKIKRLKITSDNQTKLLIQSQFGNIEIASADNLPLDCKQNIQIELIADKINFQNQRFDRTTGCPSEKLKPVWVKSKVIASY